MARLLALAVAVVVAGCGEPPAPPRGEVAVAGKMLDAAGRPLAAKVVSFNPQERDQKINSASTDQKGHFALKLVPGKYHVTVADPARAGHAMADPAAGGVTAPEKGKDMGKATAIQPGGIPNDYRNANETPWKIVVPDAGQSDIKLQIGQ